MSTRAQLIPLAGQPRLKEAIQRLVQLYTETGREDKAAEWKQKVADDQGRNSSR